MKNLTNSIKRLIARKAGDEAALRHMNAIVEERPLDINIECTNFCPMHCVFCPNHKAGRAKTVMDMDLFSKICRDFYALGGGAVGLSAMQSDLFSDDLLKQRLLELGNYRDRFWVHSTTNLVGAASLDDAELELLLRTFSYLEISIGGLSREEYLAMFGVNGFDLVMKQLRRIARMVEEKDIPVSLDLSIRTNSLWSLGLARIARIAFPVHSALLKELKKSYRIHNVINQFFSWGGLITQEDLPKGARLKIVDNRAKRMDCAIPWATLSVNTDGRVIGCGCIDWEARHVIGDMRKQGIAEIWQGEPGRNFRTCFTRGDIKDICLDCSLYAPRDRLFANPGLVGYQVTDGLYYKQ